MIGGLTGAAVLVAAVVTANPDWWSQPTPTHGFAAPEAGTPEYRWTVPPAVNTGGAPPTEDVDTPDPAAPSPIPDVLDDFSGDAFDSAPPVVIVAVPGAPGTDRPDRTTEPPSEREYRWVLVSENPNVASGFTTTFGILLECEGDGGSVRSIIERDLDDHFTITLYYSPREVVYLAAGSYLCGTPTDVELARSLADRADAAWGTSGLTATHPGVCALYRAVRSVVDRQDQATYTCPDGPPPPFPDEGTYTADLESLFTASEAAAPALSDSALEADAEGVPAGDRTTTGDPVIVPEATVDETELSADAPAAESRAPAVVEPLETEADVEASSTAEPPPPQDVTQDDPADPASTEDAGIEPVVAEPDAAAEAPAPTETPTEPAVEPAREPEA
ncbi:hypothetical protein BCL57_003080 [Agromyces flavus]|uniref:Uncharacterized protein n=1 Tax=Agromyces flavus TaxID=589382 RepID=A0ABT1KPS1_9MICO|nr:hypothetical protein [Agromyces flavus]MCP2368901.1 hypothetical protein [Agromyces flavus]